MGMFEQDPQDRAADEAANAAYEAKHISDKMSHALGLLHDIVPELKDLRRPMKSDRCCICEECGHRYA